MKYMKCMVLILLCQNKMISYNLKKYIFFFKKEKNIITRLYFLSFIGKDNLKDVIKEVEPTLGGQKTKTIKIEE